MDSENIVCPVCTLYLRPGITLKTHLSSHPKQKVIEALVRLSDPEPLRKIEGTSNQTQAYENSSHNNVSDNFNYGNSLPAPGVPPNFTGNHSFIYQQFMSTSGSQPNVLNMNPLGQQYVTIPTVLNPQMMCPPYVYQQQQVIMSSGPSMPQIIPRPLPPVEITPVPRNDIATQSAAEGVVTIDLEREPEGPDVVIIDTNNYSEAVVTNNNTTETDVKEDDNKDFKMHLEEVKIDEEEVLKAEETTTKETDKEAIVEGTQTSQNELDVNLTSPRSNDSDWSVRIRSDLSKACQTQTPSQISPSPTPLMAGDCSNVPVNENCENQYYYEQDLNAVPVTTTTVDNLATSSVSNSFEQNEPIYTAATSNMMQSNEQQLNFMDMDGMPIILNNDFISNKILLTIGGIEMEDSKDMFSALQRDEDRLGDESVSRESSNVNIRADERMPPRGELSGQESNGASENTWSRIQYNEGSSGMSTSYDLLARESWEGSDASDTESPSLQNIIPTHNFTSDVNDIPTIVSVTESPLNFKCSSCTMAFKCLQERQKHMKEVHSTERKKEKKGLNIIGSKIGKSKVKKLVVKPKRIEVKEENNFENVFTNKLKVETKPDCSEIESIVVATDGQLEPEETSIAVTSNIKLACSLCGSIFPNGKELRLHKQEEHNIVVGPRHKCLTCGEIFPNDYKYTLHLREHPLECRLCGKLFYRRQNLQMHLKCHLGVKPHKCDYCEKSFLTKQKLNEHKNVHTGETPLKCTMCDETFRRHSNLVQHKNRHHFKIKAKVKDYICQCGEIFHSLKKLAWHKEIHDPKPKSCTHCSEKFVHMSSLTRHMRRAHNERFVPTKERASENVECPICKGVYLRTSLEAHIKSHNGHRPFACLICGKDFTTKWNLKLHKWTHAARVSKPFKCDQCKGAFIRETDYIAHMNSHKSVRPYTCNYCGAQFIRKYNCQRHVKEHEKGKTYSCQVCGKAFHRSYYLKDHMRIHSGLRPYSCHICGKTSTTKSNHNKHVRIHHAREPVSTEN